MRSCYNIKLYVVICKCLEYSTAKCPKEPPPCIKTISSRLSSAGDDIVLLLLFLFILFFPSILTSLYLELFSCSLVIISYSYRICSVEGFTVFSSEPALLNCNPFIDPPLGSKKYLYFSSSYNRCMLIPIKASSYAQMLCKELGRLQAVR